MIAPALFELIDSTTEAGRIAGQLFARLTWLSMVLGSFLLVLGLVVRPVWRARTVIATVIMILSMMLMHYGVGHWMDVAREQAADRSVLMRLHAVAALLYGAACASGLMLLVRRRPEAV